MINEQFLAPSQHVGRRRALGLFKRVVVTLTYLRRNHAQHELVERYGTSQSTISRAIATMTPILAEVLDDWVPTADDLDPETQLIIDGTLLPCWSWRDHPELWSGKHRTTGMNVQVACTQSGTLAWISDPMPGKTHDANALRTSGLLDTDAGTEHLGDKGYVGMGMLTPHKKPPGGELADWQADHNTVINSIRATIERVIAHLKTWRILDTDYRRPLSTFHGTVSTVAALRFSQIAPRPF